MGLQGKTNMSDNIITLINDVFTNKDTGENVDGVTIIIDGKLKEVFDLILLKKKEYHNYTEILRDALINGINNIIESN